MAATKGARPSGIPKAAATVFVVDGWDPDSEQAFVALYRTREAAADGLKRLERRYPKAYAGVVKRTVR